MTDYKSTRAALLEKYGAPREWVRFTRPVRVVDAFPRRAGHYLGWTYTDTAPGSREVVVRISEHNFQRFYRPAEEGDQP